MSGGSCLARGRQFAKDSMLERDGFEPLVPHKKQPFLAAPVRSRNSPSATKTGCFVPGTDGSNPSPSSGESAANLNSAPRAGSIGWSAARGSHTGNYKGRGLHRCAGPVARQQWTGDSRFKSSDGTDLEKAHLALTTSASTASTASSRSCRFVA